MFKWVIVFIVSASRVFVLIVWVELCVSVQCVSGLLVVPDHVCQSVALFPTLTLFMSLSGLSYPSLTFCCVLCSFNDRFLLDGSQLVAAFVRSSRIA